MKNSLLGVATAAAALLITGVQGDGVQEDRSGTTSTTSTTSTFTSKNTRASIFWDMFPNILTDCNFGVEELEFGGVVSFIRPITCPTPTIVHINDGETFIRSHGSIEATNMFFVVHDGAKLTMVAEKAIAFHRDEKSTRPIFSVSGEVTLTADGWSDSFAEANTEDDKGLIEFENDGTLMMNQELRFTSNSIIVANAEAINQKEEQVQSTLSPRSLDLMRAYFKSSTGSSGGTDIDEAKNASKKPVTGGSVPTIPSPWASIVAVSKSAFTTWLAGPSPADALTDYDDDDAGITYAVWPGMDGSIMFAQYPATPLATETVDESAGDTAGDNLTETVGVSVLHKSNRKKARRALNLREELQKAEEEGTDVQKTDKGTWWNPFSRWGQPSERERKIGKKHMGEVDMTIDDRARLEVKVDGVRVLSKSGDLKPDFLNRFPRRRRKDDGYEVRVTADGIEVQLNGKTVWGGGAAAADTHDDPQHQERTIWGVSAADIMD
eukprot:jgi/Undpi1/8768/HiC_scaffold_25.g11230.m1